MARYCLEHIVFDCAQPAWLPVTYASRLICARTNGTCDRIVPTIRTAAFLDKFKIEVPACLPGIPIMETHSQSY